MRSTRTHQRLKCSLVRRVYQRTKSIRLGHGVIQLTTNQPQRVAEKVATLDLLSGGRVDLGVGEAAGPATS